MHGWAAVAVVAAATATAASGTPPQCTGTLANGHNLYGAGVLPYDEILRCSIADCCARCAVNASCGAWFAKEPPAALAGGALDRESNPAGTPMGACKLFSPTAAARLTQGGCPKTTKGEQPVCASRIVAVSPPSPPSPPPDGVRLALADRAAWTVSPWLATMSVVYAWAPDTAGYTNGSMAGWARANHLNTARFPAGMASYWNWENPSGYMGQSTLSPSWKGPSAPADLWMSLKEYLDLCKSAGMRPLVGINYNCHNYDKCNMDIDDAVAKAVRQVKFVVAAGFPGAFFYIGNEDGAPQHPDKIARVAHAIKAVDPTLKAFWNDNGLNPESLKAFLRATGTVMDGAEFHGKWPYGGSPGKPPFALQQWLDEVPLVEHKSGQTWRAKIAGLRAAAVEAGRPDLLLANNEYGLGKPSAFADVPPGQGGNWTRFSKSMVTAEFALEMYSSGYDMACFWDNGDGGNASALANSTAPWPMGEHMLLDTAARWRMNPMHFAFEMLAAAQNKSLLPVNTTAPRVHGFATWEPAERSVELFMMNKYQVPMNVSFTLPALLLPPRHPVAVQSVVDTPDHWGTKVSSPVSCTAGGDCALQLPAVSFSRVT